MELGYNWFTAQGLEHIVSAIVKVTLLKNENVKYIYLYCHHQVNDDRQYIMR